MYKIQCLIFNRFGECESEKIILAATRKAARKIATKWFSGAGVEKISKEQDHNQRETWKG